MRSRNREIILTARKRGDDIISLHEENRLFPRDWDKRGKNSIVAAALVCMACPVQEACQPELKIVPWGVLQNTGLVVEGQELASEQCILRKEPLIVEEYGPGRRSYLLDKLTEVREIAGKRVFRPK